MSVLKNERSENRLEVYKLATEIDGLVCRLVMNDDVVPKRWRYTFANPCIDLTGDLIDAITIAQSIVPFSDNQVAFREKYQLEAIIIVERLFQRLQRIINVLQPNPDKFQVVSQYLYKEAQALRRWKNANKDAQKTIEGKTKKIKKKDKSEDGKTEEVNTDSVKNGVYSYELEDMPTYIKTYNPSLVKERFKSHIEPSKYTLGLKEKGLIKD